MTRTLTEEQQYQQLLIDAICGVGFPAVTIAMECERVGLAHFHGNQHNENWLWDRKALWKVSIENLQELYEGMCDQREMNMEPTAPLEDVPTIINLD